MKKNLFFYKSIVAFQWFIGLHFIFSTIYSMEKSSCLAIPRSCSPEIPIRRSSQIGSRESSVADVIDNFLRERGLLLSVSESLQKEFIRDIENDKDKDFSNLATCGEEYTKKLFVKWYCENYEIEQDQLKLGEPKNQSSQRTNYGKATSTEPFKQKTLNNLPRTFYGIIVQNPKMRPALQMSNNGREN